MYDTIFFLLLTLKIECLFLRFWRGKGLVLTFHGVLRDAQHPGTYPFYNFLTLSNFRLFISFLVKRFYVMPLKTLILKGIEGSLDGNAVAITFDDGYKNNIKIALPVLEEFQVPATFFISTGFLDSTRILPVQLIKIFAYYHPVFTQKVLRRHVPSFDAKVGEKAPEAFARKVTAIFKNTPANIQQLILDELIEFCPIDQRYIAPFLFMSSTDVKSLSNSSLAIIGAHTHTHQIMSGIDDNMARQEITRNISRLKLITGRDIELFAYPNGATGDFTEKSKRLLEEADIYYAFTQVPGYVTVNVDPLSLPRMDIHFNLNFIRFQALTTGIIPHIKFIMRSLKSN